MSTIVRVNPSKCRMWDLHDRLGEEVTQATCASLIESIKRHGQKQTVLARRKPLGDDYQYELIYGARRLFAARILGIDLTIEIRTLDDRAALIEMDIENRVRKDISPYERGMSYRRWLRSGYFSSQMEIARSLGASEAQISRLLRFADLPAAVVSAFTSPREIREEWAIALAKACADPGHREEILRRARSIAESSIRLHPQRIYDALAVGSRKLVPSKQRDEIVKNSRGEVVMRIGLRARTIHLILPRHRLSPEGLRHLTDRVAGALENQDELAVQPKASPVITGDVIQPLPTI